MDPQLLSTAATTIPPNIVQQNYPDSVESLSSPQQPPRSREIMNDESLPNVPGSKLRLMCSYGGHIMPRPHDKSLCYVGGDTRIVVVDRSASLRDLCSRLSRTILNGRPFTLKYQLPNEDLDNLITVTSDEDLDNMIEEYDRIASSSMKPSSSRLRVFLFFTKPDSTLSMGSLLDDVKSETWFVDALNNSGILSRGVSDSERDAFVNLDNVPASDSSNNLESQGVAASAESLNILEDINNNNVKNVFDVVNVASGAPMLENSPSSSSLSPSIANLPPIRVRVDENGGNRLQQENKVGMKQDGGYVVSYANVAMAAIPSAGVVTTTTATVSDVNVNRVVSDDERSDYGGVIGSRKPPLPLQLVQPRTSGGGLSVPSPDSVTSDNSSIASTNSFSKIVYHQEQVQPTNIDNKAQDSSYMLPPQMDQNQQLQQPPPPPQQQQFVHSNTQYIHHPTSTNQVPISSYYQVYPQQSQQQQLHNPIGQQQYPIYVMPIGSTQPYNMTLQHNINDPNVVASSRPIIPQSGTPPIYPNKSPNPNVATNSTFVQVPSNQFQQQYVGLSQFHYQPQHPINVAPSSGGANYGYEYGSNVEGQVYYTQQQTNAPLVTQYQSMTPAATAAALSDASNQFPADNVQQTNRTSQPV